MTRSLNFRAIFRFTASVKLAVPLMLVLGSVVAWGTIVESQYNSDFAKLRVYNTWWFLALQGLLFLNIFNSTQSRWPWKRRHTGFVITHLGLLTLLTGAFITSTSGVDGILRLREGETGGLVVLPRLMLSYELEGATRAQSVAFDRILDEKSGSSLSFLNGPLGHVITAERLLPFASLNKVFTASEQAGGEVAVGFALKSKFFNVNEWLHSGENPEMQLGPATLRLIKGQPASRRISSAAPKTPKKAAVHASGTAAQVLIKDLEAGKVVAKWDLSQKHFAFHGLKMDLKRRFQRAVVAENRLEEGGPDHQPNPAVEIEVSRDAKSMREILFAKYPNFSLNKAGLFGYGFEFASPDGAAAASADEAEEPQGPMKASATPHTIEIYADPATPDSAVVELIKGGEKVMSKRLHEGETLQTPWMGMTLSLATISWGSKADVQAERVQPQRGQELPPSAIFLKPSGLNDGGFWLGEGDSKSFDWHGRKVTAAFGRETVNLPFQLKLLKFTKTDYPGTETPMSYQSEVETPDGLPHLISMNEPLKQDGYTVYQASYVMSENGPPESIFSVNRDPGRPVKYGGSLILACGIIIFTVSRSRWYQRRFGPL
jgi:hypothetical protein